MRHRMSGLVAKMAEICYSSKMLRDLANRWFQPLTHVSGGGFPRVSALMSIAERARRDIQSGSRWHKGGTFCSDDFKVTEASKVLRDFKPETATPEQVTRVLAARDMAELRVERSTASWSVEIASSISLALHIASSACAF
jgi:hypothetical protein